MTAGGAPRGRRRLDRTRLAALGLVLLPTAFVIALVGWFAIDSLPAWRHEGVGFLTGTEWFFRAARFGAAPMIYGTVVTAGVALLLAVPVGLLAAVFVAEILPRRFRPAVSGTIQLLAGVPSVVYGLLGVLVLRGWIERLILPFDPLSGDTLLTAGVLLAVMVLPTVTTLADDALRGVPASARQAARGLGLTRAETVLSVSLPAARPGLIAAVLLALGRALGETIAVFLVVGRQDNQWPVPWWSPRPLVEAGQTLTSKLGGTETFLAYGDPLHWGAIAGLAVVLLALTLVTSLVGSWLEGRRG